MYLGIGPMKLQDTKAEDVKPKTPQELTEMLVVTRLVPLVKVEVIDPLCVPFTGRSNKV
jgi:hypothetical protein